MKRTSKGNSRCGFYDALAVAEEGRVLPLATITAITLAVAAIIGAMLANLIFS
jgi:hypothetical protein